MKKNIHDKKDACGYVLRCIAAKNERCDEWASINCSQSQRHRRSMRQKRRWAQKKLEHNDENANEERHNSRGCQLRYGDNIVSESTCRLGLTWSEQFRCAKGAHRKSKVVAKRCSGFRLVLSGKAVGADPYVAMLRFFSTMIGVAFKAAIDWDNACTLFDFSRSCSIEEIGLKSQRTNRLCAIDNRFHSNSFEYSLQRTFVRGYNKSHKSSCQ